MKIKQIVIVHINEMMVVFTSHHWGGIGDDIERRKQSENVGNGILNLYQ